MHCPCHAKLHPDLQKVIRDRRFLTLLISKCASRHSCVDFLNISTSKAGLSMGCYMCFDFDMCFALQPRALFRQLNVQNAPKLRCSNHFTSISASRHSGVQFLISHLTGCLRTRRFSEPTFGVSGGAKHWNKMKPTNPNAHTHVYGTDVKTHGYAVTHNTFLQ